MKSPTTLTVATIANVTTANAYLCSPSALPPIVDVTTDGIRATLEINKYVLSVMGVRPATYVNRSFGVPGMKNRKNVRIWRRLLSCKNFSDCIFSIGKNNATTRVPHLRVIPKTSELPNIIPIIHNSVPSQKPNAYPAPISSGSPGMSAKMTCNAIIPMKANRPRNPWPSTQRRNCSGSDTNFSMGRPTK